jgi:hypothetical protein
MASNITFETGEKADYSCDFHDIFSLSLPDLAP